MFGKGLAAEASERMTAASSQVGKLIAQRAGPTAAEDEIGARINDYSHGTESRRTLAIRRRFLCPINSRRSNALSVRAKVLRGGDVNKSRRLAGRRIDGAQP